MKKRSGQAGSLRLAAGHVRLAEPDPKWAVLFENERRRLVPIAGGAFKDIVHFGSTAVPGLRAKPIIDIMASVETLAVADAMLPVLRKLGYKPADAGFVKRRFLRRPPKSDGVGYNLHIVAVSVWANKHELLVRDWLVANPDVAACYERLKEGLARDHARDVPAYTAAKSTFLRTVVNDARRSKGLAPTMDWVE